MNSSLATYRNITQNQSGKRSAKIIGLTPHIMMAKWSEKHYSYKLEDQHNLDSIFNLIAGGITEWPYHADGEEVEYFSAKTLMDIFITGKIHKERHMAYYHSARNYINALEDRNTVFDFEYGDEIPEEHKTAMLKDIKEGRLTTSNFMSIKDMMNVILAVQEGGIEGDE